MATTVLNFVSTIFAKSLSNVIMSFRGGLFCSTVYYIQLKNIYPQNI